MDFTLVTYRNFLLTLKQRNYSFLAFQQHLNKSNELKTTDKTTILRHDVDRLSANALQMAKLESEMGIKGTYYFRIVPESYDVKVIKEIAELGHEIGYHYEEMDIVSSRFGVKSTEEELIDDAWQLFKSNLDKIRNVIDVKTICAHGSPLSRFDNKLIWKKYNYRDLGIIGEPYFDIDFDEFAYFTDTGRRWNGNNVSVRDKVTSRYNFNFKTTREIIDNIDKLPDKMMFTIHPERWNDNIISWTSEFLSQNLKNIIKGFIVRSNSK